MADKKVQAELYRKLNRQMAVDQTQKLLAPETEENIKKEMLGALKAASSESVGELRDSQYAKDMEKLLVIGGKSEAEAKHRWNVPIQSTTFS